MSEINERSSLKVSDEIILSEVAKTTLQTAGVAGFSSVLPDVISKNFVKKDTVNRSIKLTKTDEGYVLYLYINVHYNMNIPSIVWDLQKNIKNHLRNKFGIKVKSVKTK